MQELAVIIPVYNEEEIIETVINEWIIELDKYGIDYKLFAYNDGSKDNTENILNKLSEKNSKLVVINQENLGHGPTILKGYKDKAKDFNWIFQIDSDREIGPESFIKLWEKRNEYDFLIVIRKNRLQTFIRKIISFFSRFCIRIFYGNKGPWDVNSPFRLMKSDTFFDLFNKLPEKTFSPNIIISGFVAKKKTPFFEYPVNWEQRKTGTAVNNFKLLKIVVKAFWQCFVFSFIVK